METSQTTTAAIDKIIMSLSNDLPATFTRNTACRHLGGFLAAGTLANLDSQKKGPLGLRTGRYVLYERGAFLVWLREYLYQAAA
ncbi:hypothetical protein [Nitratidesulfovibrio liaohensis]|jgi:hypothetical protein|uniref:Uncharacterized protein n=1 Tax=Nitratidesulfovibrio liaohensis TaxID=2604158 RepID=A0ABY9R5F0_9BACT|nr:hypothetical protein [Nitratidesulfovibrio liaohensis]WMW66950.1 hypothetical protein KPS_001583 [Nitratidesulfovibrio liaohensis]